MPAIYAKHRRARPEASPTILLVLALASLAAAILLYQGGSLYGDKTSFSFTFNMLSSLGSVVTHENQAQPWPNFFFAAGLLFTAAVIALQARQQELLAKICGYLTAGLLVALPFLPSDLFPSTHNLIFFLSVAFGALYVLLTSFLRYQDWLLKAIGWLLLGYTGFLLLAPLPHTSPYWQKVHSASQKAAVALVFTFLFSVSLKATHE